MALLRNMLRHAIIRPRQKLLIDDARSLSALKAAGGAAFIRKLIQRETDRPHVGIMLPTSGAFGLCLMGAWWAKRVAVPLNFLLKPAELEYVIEDAQLDIILTSRKLLDFLGGPEAIPGKAKLICLEDQNFKGLPPLTIPPGQDDNELAVLVYTSGTSGKPKGVELTFGNLEANAKACIEHANLTRCTGFLGVLPQFHSFGITVLTIVPLYLGSKVVYTARFVPKKIVDLIKEHKPTIFVAVPSMFGALANVKKAEPSDFESLKCPISGAEPLPDSIRLKVKDKLGFEILEGYGLTETSPVSTWSTPSNNKQHSVGLPLPGVSIHIVDDQANELGTDQDGEIVIAGPHVMRGYHHQPELTAQAIREVKCADGSTVTGFFTGDIGKVDADGFVFITGRKKEMMIVGGENVFPREIEDVLTQHPSVHAAGVVGQKDDMRGEVPIAFVQLEEDQTLDEQALKDLAKEHLASYKLPREIRVIEEMPRSPTGKILRRELMALVN